MGQLLNAHFLVSDPDFAGIVTAAAVKVALDVFAESTSTPDHISRRGLAVSILAETQAATPPHLSQFVWLCAADNAIRTAGVVGGNVTPGAIPDAEVLRVVTGAWTKVSGA